MNIIRKLLQYLRRQPPASQLIAELRDQLERMTRRCEQAMVDNVQLRQEVRDYEAALTVLRRAVDRQRAEIRRLKGESQ